jgi:hypothetical protein
MWPRRHWQSGRNRNAATPQPIETISKSPRTLPSPTARIVIEAATTADAPNTLKPASAAARQHSRSSSRSSAASPPRPWPPAFRAPDMFRRSRRRSGR